MNQPTRHAVPDALPHPLRAGRWARRASGLLLAVAGALTAGGAPAQSRGLDLAIGDPARRDRDVPVVLDGITDTATGKLLSPAQLAAQLKGVGILFVGEEHTNQDFHDVQLQAIRLLHESGRPVIIALEMFPYTEQATLDRWIGGNYTEEGFLSLGNWYGNWGYHWNFYRDIFLYAREHGLRMVAVNSPREVVRRVRASGFGELSPEEAAHFPPKLAPDSEEHQRMYRAFFASDDALHMNAEALQGLYRAQVAWDATMGWNALQALEQDGRKDAIVVVLIGAGHVTYGLGSERQIAPHFKGRIASLIPVPVGQGGAEAGRVRASYANFVWGVPPATAPRYPSLGVSLMGSIGKSPGKIIQVSDSSPASQAGIKVGDELLRVAGTPVDSEAAVRRAMAPFRWGDVVDVVLKRDGKEVAVPVPLRRTAEAG
jgi:uncharacterized iron-regulated protein